METPTLGSPASPGHGDAEDVSEEALNMMSDAGDMGTGTEDKITEDGSLMSGAGDIAMVAGKCDVSDFTSDDLPSLDLVPSENMATTEDKQDTPKPTQQNDTNKSHEKQTKKKKTQKKSKVTSNNDGKKPKKCVDKKSEDAGIMTHPCHICGESYQSLQVLIKHLAKHAEQPEQNLQEDKDIIEEEEDVEDNNYYYEGGDDDDDDDDDDDWRAPKKTRRKSTRRKPRKKKKESVSHICDVCGDSFPTLPEMRRHMQTHMVEQSWRCSSCKTSFSKKELLDQHQEHGPCQGKADASQTRKRKTRARRMNLKEDTEEDEVEVGQDVRPDFTGMYQCVVCRELFKELADLKEHKKTHIAESAYRSACIYEAGERVSLPAEQQQTMDTATVGENRPENADTNWGQTVVPSNSANQTPAAQETNIIPEDNDVKVYPCNVCDKVFSDTTSLRKHFIIHTGQKTFNCANCSGIFRSKERLSRHLMNLCPNSANYRPWKAKGKVRSDAGDSYQCTLCDKVCRTRTGLSKHKISHERRGEMEESKPDAVEEEDSNKNGSDSLSDSPDAEKNSRCKRNQCKTCGKTFPDADILEKHVQEFSTYNKLGCQQCHIICTSITALKRHMQSHTKELIYSCPACKKGFYRNEHFMKHFESSKCARSGKSVRCEVCVNTDIPIEDYIRHMKAHSGDETFSCPKCFRVFLTSFGFERHKKKCMVILDGDTNEKETARKPENGSFNLVSGSKGGWSNMINPTGATGNNNMLFGNLVLGQKTNSGSAGAVNQNLGGKYGVRCPIEGCMAVLTRKSNLKSHIRLVHTNLERVQCTVCNRSLSNKHNLKVHMLTHNEEKHYKCSFCDKQFFVAQSLKSHLLTHSKEKRFQCPICFYKYKSREGLSKHIKSHGDLPYQCPICDAAFASQKDLTYHAKTHVPAKDRGVTCSICGKYYSSRLSLMSHMKKHTGEKPFECKYCGKKFTWYDKYRRHVRMHLGKVLSCTMCNKTFTHPPDLKDHVRTHTGEKPFQCHTCSKLFSSKRALNQHLRTHDEKKHLCPICGCTFSEAVNLNKHIKTHESDGDIHVRKPNDRRPHVPNVPTRPPVYSQEPMHQQQVVPGPMHMQNPIQHHDVLQTLPPMQNPQQQVMQSRQQVMPGLESSMYGRPEQSFGLEVMHNTQENMYGREALLAIPSREAILAIQGREAMHQVNLMQQRRDPLPPPPMQPQEHMAPRPEDMPMSLVLHNVREPEAFKTPFSGAW